MIWVRFRVLGVLTVSPPNTEGCQGGAGQEHRLIVFDLLSLHVCGGAQGEEGREDPLSARRWTLGTSQRAACELA